MAKRVAILGGGIAGTTAAFALSRRGAEVTLFEREARLACGASGNPSAVILPVPALKSNPVSDFHQAAFELTLDWIAERQRAGRVFDWHPCGVVHLLAKTRLERIYERLDETRMPRDLVRRLKPEETNALTGLDLNQPALFYERGGYLNPSKFCQAFAEGYEIQTGVAIHQLRRESSCWHLIDHAGAVVTRVDAVVLANGHECAQFAQVDGLRFRKVRGQLAQIPTALIEKVPQTVICHLGYLVPPLDGNLILGATWTDREPENALHAEDHQGLLDQALRWVPNFRLKQAPPLAGRVAFRTRTPDHLPLVGPLPDTASLKRAFADYHHGRQRVLPETPVQSGLFVSVGHGSRGMISAPLGAAILAERIMGDATGHDPRLTAWADPARYLIRELKKHPEHRAG